MLQIRYQNGRLASTLLLHIMVQGSTLEAARH